MQNWYYLFAAYAAAWLGTTCYVFLGVRKQKSIEEKLHAIESRLNKQ